jgi:hypothetical protein
VKATNAKAKRHADGKGKETETPLDEPFDVDVDRYNKRIDRNSDDSLTEVETDS